MTRVKTIALALIGMLLLSACEFSAYSIPLPGGPDTGDDPMTVSAEFNDVLDLVPQSNVKVNDVDVGRITDVAADGYTAVVEMELRSDVDLPADTEARIRQTSLLGEKFVSLEVPEGGGSGELESGATIPLERTGRNPEVEEVLGALSLLLNGGGIGQLQTISRELNSALGGREPELRSALRRLNTFSTVLDDNKDDIVDAIDSLDGLARAANEQTDTIELALDELPAASLSLDRQRDDLVEALTALDELSDVGVRVIRASKAGTIRSLELLEPVLRQLANADDDVAFALQTFLTFPFVDETVGRDPQVARSIEFGDYVNLDVQLDLRLGSVGDLVDVVCSEIDATVLQALLDSGLPLDAVRDLINAICDSPTVDDIQRCLNDLGSGGVPTLDDVLGCVGDVTNSLPDTVCDAVGSIGVSLPVVCTGSGGGDGGDGPIDGLPGLRNPLDPRNTGPRLPNLPDLPLLPGLGGRNGGGNGDGGGGGNGGGNGGGDGGGGNDNGGGLLGGIFGRTAPNAGISTGGELAQDWVSMSDLASVYDPDLTMLLVPPMSRATMSGGAR